MIPGLSWPSAILGALAGVTIGLAVGFPLGISHEKAVLAAKVKDSTITILQDGKKVDDKVLNADDSTLCGLLGGC